MPCPASGTISIQSLVDEFGGSVPHSMSEYYRNGGLVPGNNTNVPESGEFSLSDCYSAVNEIQHTHSDGDTHANYATIFSSNWASTVPKRVIVPSGVTVGGTTTHAMLLPSGMGGTIVFDISGNVHGHGGSANGGDGGNAIHCIQTTGVTINVNSGGSIKAGGGGGGQGGTGGTGGQGGQGGTGGTGGGGWYLGSVQSLPGGTNYSGSYNSCSGWCGAQIGSGYNCSTSYKIWGICAYFIGSGCDYVNGYSTACYTYAEKSYDSGGCTIKSNQCRRRYFVNTGGSGGNGGNGGNGGQGGNGGNGGVGQGYGVSATSGVAGVAGTGGDNGIGGGNGGSVGNNTGNGGDGGTGGQGGQGGTGGTGGNGGAFGTQGEDGADGNVGFDGDTGNTGDPGANGNYTNGQGGSTGNGGGSGVGGGDGGNGGAAGYYIFNRSSITLNNSGTVAGQ